MVTFHSYVSLPEGRWNNLTGHLLTRVIHHTSEMILEAMGITYLGARARCDATPEFRCRIFCQRWIFRILSIVSHPPNIKHPLNGPNELWKFPTSTMVSWKGAA